MNLSAQRDMLVTYPTRELFLNNYCWPKYEIYTLPFVTSERSLLCFQEAQLQKRSQL